MMQATNVWAGPGPKAATRPMVRAVDDLSGSPRRNKILVIEDDPIVSLGMEEILTEAGYLILASVARGEEALAIAERHRPDLILADVKLAGGMDGIQSVTAILMRCKIPVIFVTAHTDPGTRTRMEATRPAGILAKPVADTLLLHAVAAALRD